MQHIGLPRALDMKDAEELIERVLIELRENNGITCAKILELSVRLKDDINE